MSHLSLLLVKKKTLVAKTLCWPIHIITHNGLHVTSVRVSSLTSFTLRHLPSAPRTWVPSFGSIFKTSSFKGIYLQIIFQKGPNIKIHYIRDFILFLSVGPVIGLLAVTYSLRKKTNSCYALMSRYIDRVVFFFWDGGSTSFHWTNIQI